MSLCAYNRAQKWARAPLTSALITTALVLAPALPAHAHAPAADVLLTGRVLHGSTPVPAATITLIAWPNVETLDKLPARSPVGTTRIATTSTGTNGSYTLAPDLASLAARYREPDGTVNMTVEVVTGSADQMFNLPAAGADQPAAAYATTAVAGVRPARLDFDVAGQTVADSLSGGPRMQRVATTEIVPSSPPGGWHCRGWHTGDRLGHRPERFMNVYAVTGGRAKVTETAASQHTLGVAIKVSSGPWTVDGSASETMTDESSATLTYRHDVSIANLVDYRKYNRWCIWPERGSTRVDHLARPGHFAALQVQSLTQAIKDAAFSHCLSVSRGKYTKSRGSSHHFAVGVNLYFIKVEAQAAYSANTTISWHITRRRKLCGSNDLWAHASEASVRKASPPKCVPGKPCHTTVRPAVAR